VTVPELKVALATETEMHLLAAQLAERVKGGAILFLYGELGVGKTTFTRGLLHHLGHHAKVKSPTYALVEPYEIEGQLIFHFDFYRVQDANELKELGIHEYFSASSICIVEWPQNALTQLPTPDVICYFDFAVQGRVVRMQAHSKRGEKILSFTYKK
jgi:tRNA threonylcarbamoyladenosine biosynthesis protein TsaE